MPLNQEDPSFKKLTKREREILRIPSSQPTRTQADAVADQARDAAKRSRKTLQDRLKHGAAEWE